MAENIADRYKGRSVREVLRECDRQLAAGAADLAETLAILRLCRDSTTDPYRRGGILQRIWQAEKRQGQHQLYFSQAGQDRHLHNRFFKDRTAGVFVEIGGYNGFEGSNCLFLEKFRGWTGVIVEASERLARQIPQTRSQPVIHAAIMDRDGTAEFIEITSGYTQMGGLAESYDESTIEAVRRRQQHEERKVEVPAMRLDTLLRDSGLSKIDYLSVDAEGAERLILGPFDFDEFDISVITTENNSGSEDGSLADILKPAGYRLDAILGVDEVWTRLPE